jgi:outer membrane autotransporter protein
VNVNAATSFGNCNCTNFAGGTVNINANATFTGGTIINAGLFTLSNGASLSGLSNFQNSGILAAPTSGPTTSAISVGTFTHSGVINLQTNNQAGDRLTINGNYVGVAGSSILLDFATQTSTADQVIINGNASGSTSLNVRNLTPGAAVTTGPTLVQVNGAPSANVFTLGNLQNFGTIAVVLVPQSSPTGASFGLATVTIPTSAGLSGAVAVQAVQSLGFTTSSAVLDRLGEVRDVNSRNDKQANASAATAYARVSTPADPIGAHLKDYAAVSATSRPVFWARALGDYEQRSGSATFDFAGQGFTSNLGYRQRTGALMAGVDVVMSGLTSANDGIIGGLLIGGIDSHVNLSASSTKQDYTGPTVGMYGTYFNGPWFTDVLLKVDTLGLEINGTNLAQSANLVNFNVATNSGYKFDFQKRFYIEPTAGLEYVKTSFTDTTALTSTTVPLNNGFALRGRIGARIGTEWVTNNVRVEPSLVGYVYSVLDSSGASLFVNGVGINLPTDKGKVRGELQASVNFLNLQTGWSGFGRVDTRFGDDLVAAGAKSGIRYQW